MFKIRENGEFPPLFLCKSTTPHPLHPRQKPRHPPLTAKPLDAHPDRRLAPAAGGRLAVRPITHIVRTNQVVESFRPTCLQVFFSQKAAQWRARSPPRAPQSAKFSKRRGEDKVLSNCEAILFFFVSFFFCAYTAKRKSGGGLCTRQGKGKPHLWFPLFPLRGNSPFRALSNDKGVSPPAGGDQGSAFGNRELLEKLDQNFPLI